MKIEIKTPRPILLYNIVSAIEGARLAYNSKLCSTITEYNVDQISNPTIPEGDSQLYAFGVDVDNVDQRLFKRLSNVPVGSGHDKFLACIPITIDIIAARYWWQEMDTYSVGTRKLSESTMHTLLKSDLTIDDFEIGHDLLKDAYHNKVSGTRKEAAKDFILKFNHIKEDSLLENTEKVNILKGLLIESFLQKRRVFLNYGVLKTIYKQRHSHKLLEWRVFCDIIKDHSKVPFLYLAFDD